MTLSSQDLKMETRDIEILNEIKRFAFKTTNCTAGIYCKNLQEIRGLFNAKGIKKAP